MRSAFFCTTILATLCAAAAPTAKAQSVQPVIAEYNRAADGFFEVVNDSAAPQIVTLEPRSFAIDADGAGIFRPLDPSIHLQLSSTSVHLEPQQHARIFYKVNADALPAWLCIYASFSALKEGKGVNLRIMLPHTIYLYGRAPLQREDISIGDVHYDMAHRRITAELKNLGASAARASEVEITGHHVSRLEGGFPLLPGSSRTLSFEWTDDQRRPETVDIRFPKFQLRLPIPAAE